MSIRATIPSQQILRGMSDKEKSALANAIATDNDPAYAKRTLESLSNALLMMNRGWESDAYSEDRRTGRNRRIAGHEIQTSQLGRADVISVAISDVEVSRIIAQAGRAGLTRIEQLVYTLIESGCTQADVAQELGISQQSVSRKYAVSLEKLKWSVSQSAAYVFFLESHNKPMPVFEGEVEDVSEIVEWQAKRTDVWKIEWYQRS